ncbi:NADH-ubiquinone oxidoreductase kD subunit [Planoprotostelium fungivorum]|uniref:NADH dehydrogenase [ubiquinone] iron-sulfur protein 5 n=1 Tax=Planoprotostelium fungivorum TaxID=1890364 RepID=A0A2P6P068_9EUKA|nr:NADH-ubiquinone oxidoreductase kD subunit [Planoprotostelium fungivorum]
MSSGFGNHGTTGRCWFIWKDLANCMRVHSDKLERARKCVDFEDDYQECLSQEKEYDRVSVIGEQLRQNKKKGIAPPKSQPS